ncbi:MAG: hypothetical protein KDE20_23795, partial [Caldilineaceae bacterium]|nr:hypothetical protein [Caldilineaceae bacterium]
FEPVPKSTPSQTFTYDPFNRLSGITSSEFGTASYQIAGTGMRAAKTVNGQATHFVYGPSAQLYYERNMSSGQTTHHLYLHGQPIGMVRGGELYYVLPDHLGRPEMLTDDSGTQVVWRARLAAFDRHVAIDQIGGYHLGFPGQYHDQESGFAYNIFRDYDPATGRYLQSDPIDLQGGTNSYAYTDGDPLSFVDPSGTSMAFQYALLAGGCAVNAWGGYEASQTYADLQMGVESSEFLPEERAKFCTDSDMSDHNKVLRDAVNVVDHGMQSYGQVGLKFVVGTALAGAGAKGMPGVVIGAGCAVGGAAYGLHERGLLSTVLGWFRSGG